MSKAGIATKALKVKACVEMRTAPPLASAGGPGRIGRPQDPVARSRRGAHLLCRCRA